MSEATEQRLEQKRFVASPESIDLMSRAKSIFFDLQKETPYLSGIAFFGSRTKSIERQDSDLDAVIFYDSNKFEDPNSSEDVKLSEIKDRISREIGISLGDHKGWKQNLSLEKTDIDLFNYVRFARSLRSSSREQAVKVLSNMPEAQNLFSRFFLGVGDGLYKNRKYILDQLSLDNDGDEQFGLLMGAMSLFERDNREDRVDVPDYSRLPMTIEKARQYFLTEPRVV